MLRHVIRGRPASAVRRSLVALFTARTPTASRRSSCRTGTRTTGYIRGCLGRHVDAGSPRAEAASRASGRR
jgi:hypothetical protein